MAARGKGWRQLARRHGVRKIPWRYGRNHAHWLLDDYNAVVALMNGDHAAVGTLGLLAEPFHIESAVKDFTARLGERLAHFHGEE